MQESLFSGSSTVDRGQSGWEDKLIPTKKANEPFEHEIGHNLAEAGSGFSAYRKRQKEQSSAESRHPNEDQNIEFTISFPTIITEPSLNQNTQT